MALTLKTGKPAKGMQYELDLVGAIGRTKLRQVDPFFTMLKHPKGLWVRVTQDAQGWRALGGASLSGYDRRV